MDIITMHRKGLKQRAIARKLGINRNTVKKHIENPNLVFEPPQSRNRKSLLDPYGDNKNENGVKSAFDPCSKLIRVKSRLDPIYSEKAWRFWLSRRSHKGTVWYEELRSKYPFPKPRIVHNI